MKKLLINAVVGAALFVGALFGGLAATGRLNHEGAGQLPLLGSLFPPPPPEAMPAEADLQGAKGAPAEASAGGAEPQGEGVERKQKVGRSVEKPEAKPAANGHGGGHGAAGDDHGAAGKDKDPHAAGSKSSGGKPAAKDGPHAAERDFDLRQQALANDRKNKYAPGGLFTFEGMPAGLTPEQINEAWQRVQSVLTDLDQRKAVLDQREKDLQILADDVDQRRRKLTEKMVEIENEARKLDARIAAFTEQVKLVRSDEVAALRKNAQTYASIEPSKVAQLVGELWRTDKGQDEVLKTFEFMDKDRVNEILEQLPNPTIIEVMRKRLRISRETVPSAGPPR
jgi:hypothetical protein